MGSILVARRAGSQQASNATVASSTGMTTKLSGSVAATPKRRLRIKCVSANAPARPMRTPTAASFIPCRRTRPITSARFAQLRPRRLPSGHEPEQQSSQQRETRREGQHATVDANFLGARQMSGAQPHQHWNRPEGQENSGQSAKGAQQQAFGQKLSNQAK